MSSAHPHLKPSRRMPGCRLMQCDSRAQINSNSVWNSTQLSSLKKDIPKSVRSEFPPALRAEDKMADLISTRRQVPCEKCPLRPMRVFREFSPDELAFISDFKSGELTAKAGTTLFLQGAHVAHLYTLLSGWAFRYMTLPDGRRQILNFAFPGEF